MEMTADLAVVCMMVTDTFHKEGKKAFAEKPGLSECCIKAY